MSDTNELHVVRNDDTITHDTLGDCVCGPVTSTVVRDDGSIGWLVVHRFFGARS